MKQNTVLRADNKSCSGDLRILSGEEGLFTWRCSMKNLVIVCSRVCECVRMVLLGLGTEKRVELAPCAPSMERNVWILEKVGERSLSSAVVREPPIIAPSVVRGALSVFDVFL